MRLAAHAAAGARQRSRGNLALRVAAAGLAWLLCATASAETRRIAVVVGANAGDGERAPLRYAESDAGKLAQVLIEMGGVERQDLFLLQGRTLADLRGVMGDATRRVAAHHKVGDTRVLLLFYFSGHSDGVALELGRERLPFADLRAWMRDTGAEVRVGIVDACKSGALIAAKGGKPGPAFEIRMADELSSTGEALLTSSAADELALESREIRGSFFTHHLVSGLRGAADVSGDGVVTLAEAYRYAYERTVSASGATLAGAQHPVYDYRLAGQGELVLAALERPAAAITLPDGYDRFLVVYLLRDQVIAEVPRGGAMRLAVAPGSYAVRAFRGGRAFAARLSVEAGHVRALAPDELSPVDHTPTQGKGAEPAVIAAAARPLRGPSLFMAGGTQLGAVEAAALGAFRLGVRSKGPSGWSAALDMMLGRGATFYEATALAFGGYRFGLANKYVSGFLGLEVGLGLINQHEDDGNTYRSVTVLGAPWLGGAVHLTPRVAIALEAHLPVGWMRRDGKDAVAFFPAGWLGLLITL